MNYIKIGLKDKPINHKAVSLWKFLGENEEASMEDMQEHIGKEFKANSVLKILTRRECLRRIRQKDEKGKTVPSVCEILAEPFIYG